MGITTLWSIKNFGPLLVVTVFSLKNEHKVAGKILQRFATPTLMLKM